ncbi:MAG: hypothetical protein HQ511_12260 [Rhodospirillales bacterium]|nr:hypothetical protein [Rhodospirillales bacterium]
MKYLDLPIALGAAVAAANWIALDMWSSVGMELVLFLTVLGMGALVAMTVLLSLKGPEEMNVGEARAIGAAWHGLAMRLTAILCFSVGGAVTLIASRALIGRTVVTIETPEMIFREDFQWALSGLIAFFTIMALTRMFPVLRGVSSLSKVNRELLVKGVLRHQARVAEHSGGRVETLKVSNEHERLFNR